LDQLFPQKDIFKALLFDTLIQNHLTKKDPERLNELIDNLEGGCEIYFKDILKSFCFAESDSDSVEVRFGLRYGCEVMRENFTLLTIKLEIPSKIKSFFLKRQF
jgi:hypothetical protein